MADAQDLGSCTERCRGSTPLSCSDENPPPPYGGKDRNTMITYTPPRYRSFLIFLALSAIAMPGSFVCADTVWHKSAGAKNALKYDNVKIEKVDGDYLVFLSASGNETRKRFDE